jgi:hypothetical protein
MRRVLDAASEGIRYRIGEKGGNFAEKSKYPLDKPWVLCYNTAALGNKWIVWS